ncbi:MAG: hypothetical protein ABEJ36_00060 [Candidatus Nanosalina sp.]
MTDRVSQAAVEDIFDGYTGPQRDAALNSLGAQRRYVAEGRRRDPSELPEFGGPDSVFYEKVSRQELEDFDQALSTVKTGVREEDSERDPLVLNEEAMYDDIASGSIEFYAPWNIGMDQDEEEILESLEGLQGFAEVLNDETVLDAGVTIYTLDAYAENNGNEYRGTKQKVTDRAEQMDDLSVLEWSDFEKEVLGQPLDPDLGYRGLRRKESELMSGNVRISPTENPDQEDKQYVDTTGNPKENEAVVYGPFFGPWKSGYDDRKSEVPELLEEMRTV